MWYCIDVVYVVCCVVCVVWCVVEARVVGDHRENPGGGAESMGHQPCWAGATHEVKRRGDVFGAGPLDQAQRHGAPGKSKAADLERCQRQPGDPTWTVRWLSGRRPVLRGGCNLGRRTSFWS
jgi:hypothetical protein